MLAQLLPQMEHTEDVPGTEGPRGRHHLSGWGSLEQIADIFSVARMQNCFD